jgi:hypothetical protein
MGRTFTAPCRLADNAPSAAATCAALTDGTTTLGWWRSDPSPDVMVFNDFVENADELRAAAGIRARCGAQQC